MDNVSCGIDIIEVARIGQAIKRWGDHFLRHIFCDEEIDYSRNQKFPNQHFAARFAAKEAVLKAIGDNGHLSWKDMQIMHDKHGKPYCLLKEKDSKRRISISVSHTKNYAVANAIITS